MNISETSSETLLNPDRLSPIGLSHRDSARTDMNLHIEAVRELIDVLLNQLNSLISERSQLDDCQNLNLREKLRRYEIELIQEALTLTHGHQARAAQFLGVNATTLSEKIRRYQVQWPVKTNSLPAPINQLKTESPAGAC